MPLPKVKIFFKIDLYHCFCFSVVWSVYFSMAWVGSKFLSWQLNRHLLFQVRPVAEDEMFRVIRSGKRKSMYPLIILSLLCS